jgi:UDP-N-acetylmuramyl pentapeptide synthase
MAELGPDAEAYHTALAPLFEENRIDRVHLVGDLYAGLWDALPERLRASRSGSLSELRRALEADLADGDCVLFKGSHSTGIHKLVGGLKQM